MHIVLVSPLNCNIGCDWINGFRFSSLLFAHPMMIVAWFYGEKKGSRKFHGDHQ